MKSRLDAKLRLASAVILAFSLTTIILSLAISCSKVRPEVDVRLQTMLTRSDYFSLRDALPSLRKHISKTSYLYYHAFIENAFGHPVQSLSDIDLLLSQYRANMADSLVTDLHELMIDNYVKTYQYQKAAAATEKLLAEYSQDLDSAKVADHQNSLKIWQALVDVSPQQIHIPEETTLPLTRDKMNLLNIPVQCAREKAEFIFDTGANISTLNESYAAKMKVRIMNTSFDVGASQGNTVKSNIGVADSFWIGSILVEHAVFLIVPDEQMSFPQVDYAINGIVGFPVIHQMKELRLRKDGTLIIPALPSHSDLRNLAIDGLFPIVRAYAGSDTLRFALDSGAKRSGLFKSYLDTHAAEIKQKYQPVQKSIGGGGGITETTVYQLENFSLRIGSKDAVLPIITVQTENLRDCAHDGDIGQDVISQFDEMVLNFEDMFLDFH